ncbi:MAG: ATP-binding protein [Actinomycetota bacterium]|nr:ATP-binding protein [Actinomycetota bacterium]
MSRDEARQVDAQVTLLLMGGPAGAGKSTVATAWCHTRRRAVRIDLDQVRDLIVAGQADPQILTPLQAEQYELSVRACVALARTFLAAGYDVALETVFEPDDFAQRWRPLLTGLSWHLVILRPSLPVTLARSRGRAKRVLEEHTITQHQRTGGWSADLQIDTTDLSVEHTLELINHRLTVPGRT